MTCNNKKEIKETFPTIDSQIIYISGVSTFYILKSGTNAEKCGTLSNPCRIFEQVWKQVEQYKTSINSTVLITDSDIVIDNRVINLQNNKNTFHMIHIISKEDNTKINISNCTFKSVRIKLDNSNISLHIQNSRLINAGILIESEGNKRHLNVKIANSHFSGHFPEHILHLKKVQNVYIEFCLFTYLEFYNTKSVIIKAWKSILNIRKSTFTNNTSFVEVLRSTVNISMSLFEGNTGGCIRGNNASLQIADTSFNRNTGGCIHGNNASLQIVDTSFTRNTAKCGAAVKAQETKVIIERCSLKQNAATGKDWFVDGGGAIYISHSSSLKMIDTNVTLNIGKRGGAVYAVENCRVSMDSCSLSNNSATYYGGAIYIHYGSSLKMIDTNVALNIGWYGGAVYAVENCRVSMDSCSLSNNSAREFRGAIYIADGSSLKMIDTNVTLNIGKRGGAVYAVENCRVSMDSCSLSNNSATYYGGAIYIHYGSSLKMIDTNVALNIGWYGGAVYAVENCRVSMDSCSLSNNSAREFGGAIYIADGSSLKMIDTNVTLNIGKRGGAVYAVENCRVSMDSCSLSNNSATYYGGAIYIHYGSSLKMIDTNVALNIGWYGGAVYAEASCYVSLDSCSLYNNSATYYGGAIYVWFHSTLHVMNCSIRGNTAETGGALAVAHESQATLKGGIMSSNSASQDGGALFTGKNRYVLEGNTIINIISMMFTNNTSIRDGGAVFIEYNSTLGIENSIFAENSAGRDGGVIKSRSKSNVIIASSQFNNNTSIRDGGAVFTKYSTLGIETSIFTENSAGRDGGVIKSQLKNNVIIAASQFNNNKAKQDGGAFLVTESVMDIKDSDFTENSCGRDGGAIKIKINSITKMTKAQLAKNTAGSRGGAVMVTHLSELSATGSTIIQNRAATEGGAVMINDHSRLSIIDSNFLQNIALGFGKYFWENYYIYLISHHAKGTW